MADSDLPDFEVVGGRRHPTRDVFHALLRLSWPSTILGMVLSFLVINAAFGLVFLIVGGVAEMTPGFASAFFFSVQTMATIGYGAMHPATMTAHTVVLVESIVSLLYTALWTGLVFAKFSRPMASIAFTRKATVSMLDGVPVVAFRVAHERSSSVCDALVRVVFTRREESSEGHWYYRARDLVLVRERIPVLTRSWVVMHRIDDTSPLHGMTLDELVKVEGELLVTLAGTDEVTLQPVFARKTYDATDLAFGMRFRDVLEPLPNGRLRLHVARFDDLIPE